MKAFTKISDITIKGWGGGWFNKLRESIFTHKTDLRSLSRIYKELLAINKQKKKGRKKERRGGGKGERSKQGRKER